MSRVAQTVRGKALIALVIFALAITGIGLGISSHNNSGVKTVTNAQHQLTQISYSGQNGVTAYALLTKYAKVKSQKFYFGYFVTSINGVAGNGPKYWTLYVNGKESNFGPSSYTTKNSDHITWILQ